LLQTFGDQAVIAIENVRLFKELEARNRDLTDALEQQTATSEVLRTIAYAQSDVQPVFDTIVRSAARLCHAVMASVLLTDGRMLYLPANYGSSPEALSAVRARFPRPLDRETVSGAAILTRSVVHVPDVQEPSVIEFTRQAGQVLGYRSLVTVPMLREGEVVGALNVCRREPGRFSDAEVALLKTFADQAVIAVENVRLFKELEARNRDLTATSGILQVMASSPTDTQPVFDAIARSVVQLCEGLNTYVFLFDGERYRLVAFLNASPETLASLLTTTELLGVPDARLDLGPPSVPTIVRHCPALELL
jgi:two-component system NtrC family sensor kinase